VPQTPEIEITEVGPRDGLQSIDVILPTEAKQAWISAEAAAGVREIEVCSFVPAKLLPQFADAEPVVAHARTVPDLTTVALVPNLKGAKRAMEAGVHKVSFTLSVSHSHSLANVRKTPDEQLAEFRSIVEHRNAVAPGTWLSAGLSTAFGCTYEGAVSESAVRRLALALVEAGADDITLADTVGYANPAQIKRVFTAVKGDVGAKLAAAHLHDTRGLGLANACAVLDCGVTGLDASLGGIGGCPYAPGASGNIVMEDLVFMLEAMGLRTGIDLERLLAVRRQVVEALPGVPFHGALARAGLPRRTPKGDIRAA
jgi:hydroxymethylglutaryl-CoA lyase